METSNTITKKQYTEGINSESIMNFYCNTKVGKNWCSSERQLKTFRSNFNSTNKSRFTQLFGKHNFVFDGEVRYYVWEFNFKGRKFLALTDRDNSFKGTSYEIVLEDDKEISYSKTKDSEVLAEICLDFTDEMCKILKTTKDDSGI
jgi:hypothetical protein